MRDAIFDEQLRAVEDAARTRRVVVVSPCVRAQTHNRDRMMLVALARAKGVEIHTHPRADGVSVMTYEEWEEL